jgi:hypothetical protein
MVESERQKQTRRIIIEDKVFKAEDLRRIARIFEKQRHLVDGTACDTTVSYQISLRDDTTFESDSQLLFSDESLTTAARPMAIGMSFRNYSKNCYLRVSIRHGDKGYGNEAEISGTDLAWVRENFLAV